MLLAASDLSNHVWVKNVLAVGSLVGAVGGLVLAIMKIHGMLKKHSGAYSAWRTRKNAEAKARREMPAKLEALTSRFDAMDLKLTALTEGNRTADGESMGDAVQFLRREEDLRFWTQRRPAFRCDDSGRVTKVSQGLCHLASTVTEQDLFRLGWKRLAHSLDEMRDWFNDWQGNVAPPRSPFAGELELTDLSRTEPRGRWVFRMTPIGTYRGVHSWEGSLYPVDQTAKDLAEAQGWEMR